MKHARSDYDERIQDSANLIPDDEPVLLIRGQDVCAVDAINAWIGAARSVGADPELIAGIERHRERVIEWQEDARWKVPDAPEGVLS